jgi:hypothetical protein
MMLCFHDLPSPWSDLKDEGPGSPICQFHRALLEFQMQIYPILLWCPSSCPEPGWQASAAKGKRIGAGGTVQEAPG